MHAHKIQDMGKILTHKRDLSRVSEPTTHESRDNKPVSRLTL